MPALYSQEDKGGDAKIAVKFFTPDADWTWYATEFDGEDTFFIFRLAIGKEFVKALDQIHVMRVLSKGIVHEGSKEFPRPLDVAVKPAVELLTRVVMVSQTSDHVSVDSFALIEESPNINQMLNDFLSNNNIKMISPTWYFFIDISISKY